MFSKTAKAPAKTQTWHFPIPRPHCGVPLGNGNQGVLVWGEETLCLTVARAGFWDRRGGNPFATKATFQKVRELLEAGDEAGIRALFAEPDKGSRVPKRPQQLGGARLEIRFPDAFYPQTASLDLENGVVTIQLLSAAGEWASVKIQQSMEAELFWLESPDGILGNAEVELKPTWDWVGVQLEGWGVAPPKEIEIEDGGGFVQELPEDPALALVWRQKFGKISVATALGDLEEAAQSAATLAASAAQPSTFFWRRYQKDVPQVSLPDPILQRFWDLGIYKQAGMTTPSGVAATLQGPWMEEYQLPPWSNDYHLNINLEMIYWPALATNRLDHFAPLWTMIREWIPTLQANGETFFGRKGALMLPHAVDDKCQVVGSFWTGTIDHACTAWIAQTAWLHFRYALDESVLREIAWPLLNGAFEGFWAMHEEKEGRFSLPVSVSPEYRGAGMNAWGRDASFQLAAWHMVAQILPQAAQVLGQPIDPRWRETQMKAPPYSLVNGRIGLWEGLELEESHRHHAHLAAIYPFVSLDPLAPEHWETVRRSFLFWIEKGAGLWTGWCLPWASILCSRLNQADAAVAWLQWLDHWCNEGFGTRHNADFPGVAAWDNNALSDGESEIMQMDAAMGALTAITELLVQNRRDAIYVLPAIPRRWRELRFDGIRTEGAFFVGATVEAGKTLEIRVRSEQGGHLKLAHGLGDRIQIGAKFEIGPIFEKNMTAGEEIKLRRAGKF